MPTEEMNGDCVVVDLDSSIRCESYTLCCLREPRFDLSRSQDRGQDNERPFVPRTSRILDRTNVEKGDGKEDRPHVFREYMNEKDLWTTSAG